MPVPGLSLLGPKRIRGFVSILCYINPTIIIIIMTFEGQQFSLPLPQNSLVLRPVHSLTLGMKVQMLWAVVKHLVVGLLEKCC